MGWGLGYMIHAYVVSRALWEMGGGCVRAVNFTALASILHVSLKCIPCFQETVHKEVALKRVFSPNRAFFLRTWPARLAPYELAHVPCSCRRCRPNPEIQTARLPHQNRGSPRCRPGHPPAQPATHLSRDSPRCRPGHPPAQPATQGRRARGRKPVDTMQRQRHQDQQRRWPSSGQHRIRNGWKPAVSGSSQRA